MSIKLLILSIIFAVVGILIKYLKCYWLIAGYNTTPKSKRNQVDIKGLGNFIGNACFGISMITIGMNISNALKIQILEYILIAALLLGILYTVIGSQAYRKTKN